MAKRKKGVELENVELKPQVIGYTYKKKSNLGRVIFIFICFILAVYYINDISVYINNLLGKKTADTIQGGTTEKNPNPNPSPDVESKDVVYNIYSNGLSLQESNLIINNFNLENQTLTFDVNNTTSNEINLTGKKYFMETYNENKTLLERFKVDFNSINANSKISLSYDLKNDFYYLVLVEKTVEDYPNIDLETSDDGMMTFTCQKDTDEYSYTFKNNALVSLTETVNDSNVADENYITRHNSYQRKVNEYKDIEGITATFNSTSNGYTAIFTVDLGKVNLEKLSEKYYYGYNEIPKVVYFEMTTYGFTCKQD